MRKKRAVTQAQLNNAINRYNSIMKESESRIKGISDLTKLRREQIQEKYAAILKSLKE